MQTFEKGTWIDDEEKAYPAGSIRQSRRYCGALCPDGKVRRVHIGISDTYFSIPGTVTVKGKHVAGYVSMSEPNNPILCFHANRSGKNAGVFV